MDGRHLDVVAEVGEVFQGYGLVFVVPNNVFHHECWGEGLGVCEVAGEVEAGRTVVWRVGDV